MDVPRFARRPFRRIWQDLTSDWRAWGSLILSLATAISAHVFNVPALPPAILWIVAYLALAAAAFFLVQKAYIARDRDDLLLKMRDLIQRGTTIRSRVHHLRSAPDCEVGGSVKLSLEFAHAQLD
jgi:hypothetical protein